MDAYERNLDREEQRHANQYGEIWNPDTHTWDDWIDQLGRDDDPDHYYDLLRDEDML